MPEETPVKRTTATRKTAGSATAAKAPSTRKTTVAATAEKKTPASKTTAVAAEEKPATRRKASAKKAPLSSPSAEERYGMVQDAAYYLAEKEGFQGAAVDYWIRAEREIATQLGEIKD
ncbi:MAG TPA: DUF2934 domain-containing protein [Accumulibacter sp.]|jgi:hypothetical protein|nr:DUF2934 domain-containing protein [Accumulibacter sp.]HQC80481.1 DUF2934 domain-containing protein [Accumulibacter sp.]